MSVPFPKTTPIAITSLRKRVLSQSDNQADMDPVRRELRIYENTDELSTDLAEYIARLSETSIKEHAVFSRWFTHFLDVDGKELRIYENADELSTDLAEYIADLSDASIREHGVFTVALSGGSLIALMRKLCESPHSIIVDWDKWHVFWADERAVSKSHPYSNYKLAKKGLIAKVRINYNHVHSMNDSLTVERAAERYQFVIRQLVRIRLIAPCVVNDCPRFDLVLLRMGPDGHVAALFPNHPALDEKEQWVTFMTDSPKAPPERITFTLPVINSAANVAVVVTGAKKAEAAHLAIDGVGPDEPDLPAGMVRPRDGKLVWFMDSDAASKLDGVNFSEQS